MRSLGIAAKCCGGVDGLHTAKAREKSERGQKRPREKKEEEGKTFLTAPSG